MKREDWPVGDYGVRPAGKQDECFYCHEKVGTQHKTDCVIRERTVVVEVRMHMVVTVPEFWTTEDIEFHRNESTWCANNLYSDVERLFTQTEDPEKLCMCNYIGPVKYLREASEQEEKYQNLTVKDSKS